MRFALPVVGCACLLIGLAQFARRVHAQAESDAGKPRIENVGKRPAPVRGR